MQVLSVSDLAGKCCAQLGVAQRKLKESSSCRRAGKSIDLHRAKTIELLSSLALSPPLTEIHALHVQIASISYQDVADHSH